MNIMRTLVTIISLSFIASNSFASNEDTARSWINAAYTCLLYTSDAADE